MSIGESVVQFVVPKVLSSVIFCSFHLYYNQGNVAAHLRFIFGMILCRLFLVNSISPGVFKLNVLVYKTTKSRESVLLLGLMHDFTLYMFMSTCCNEQIKNGDCKEMRFELFKEHSMSGIPCVTVFPKSPKLVAQV